MFTNFIILPLFTHTIFSPPPSSPPSPHLFLLL
jgi:hypothetical protein